MLVAAATVVSTSRLAQARVAARSIRRHHPEIAMFAALTDPATEHVGPASQLFTPVGADALAIDDLPGLRFAYEEEALAAAIIPHVLAHLLDLGFDAVLLVGGGRRVDGDLGHVLAVLAALAPVALVPRMTRPTTSSAELDVLVGGVYDAGILGVGAAGGGRAFLAWWADRLRRHCVVDHLRGLHGEQRHLDLVPGLFAGAHVVREGTRVGHATATDLAAEGGPDARRYAYDRFDNGVPIPPLAREIFRDLGDDARRFGDPFATGHAGSYFSWLNAPVDGLAVTRLWRAVLERRTDLREAFPDALDGGAHRYMRWAGRDGVREYRVPRALLGEQA